MRREKRYVERKTGGPGLDDQVQRKGKGKSNDEINLKKKNWGEREQDYSSENVRGRRSMQKGRRGVSS